MFNECWLKDMFIYDKNSGELYWKEFSDELLLSLGFDKVTYNRYSKSKRNFTESVGTLGNHGYLFVNIPYYHNGVYRKKVITVHRIIWFLHHGYWPDTIDHINGNRVDNHISNLRIVSSQENAYNGKLRETNSSGKTGVSWSKSKSKWRAYATVKGKQVFLGYFTDKDEAIRSREDWELDNNIICRG